jgi:hypothetical protein
MIYQQKPPQKQKLRCNMSKKNASTVFGIFDQLEVTATGSVDYPRVRHSPRKCRLRVQPE